MTQSVCLIGPSMRQRPAFGYRWLTQDIRRVSGPPWAKLRSAV